MLPFMNWQLYKSFHTTFRTLGMLCTGVAMSTSATACEYDTWLFQLPGETEKAARARSEEISRSQLNTRRFEREAFDLKNAKIIYIARVLASNRGQVARARPRSVIEPVEAITGAMPAGTRALVETQEQGCSNWGDGYGDGEGTGATVGTLVVVFEGLPKSEWRPNGMDSLQATSIRHSELLDRVSKYGKALDD